MESYKSEVTLRNRRGLHLRFAGLIAKAARQFVADIRLGKGNRLVDAKSPLALVSLAAPFGTQLTLRIEGPDAEKAATIMDEVCQREKV